MSYVKPYNISFFPLAQIRPNEIASVWLTGDGWLEAGVIVTRDLWVFVRRAVVLVPVVTVRPANHGAVQQEVMLRRGVEGAEITAARRPWAAETENNSSACNKILEQ